MIPALAILAGLAALATAAALMHPRRGRRGALELAGSPIATIGPEASARSLDRVRELFPGQPVFPVVDQRGALCGLVVADDPARGATVAEVTRSAG